MNIRQDAWHEQDDLVLAETILRHIREGSTQLSAFEEVANRLNRTSPACGFRWNNEVRKRYVAEIKEAKSERHNNKGNKSKSQLAIISSVGSKQTDYAEQIMTATRSIIAQNANMAKQIKTLSEELQEARECILRLEEQLQSSQQPEKINEDYQALLQILQRARSLGVTDRLSV